MLSGIGATSQEKRYEIVYFCSILVLQLVHALHFVLVYLCSISVDVFQVNEKLRDQPDRGNYRNYVTELDWSNLCFGTLKALIGTLRH